MAIAALLLSACAAAEGAEGIDDVCSDPIIVTCDIDGPESIVVIAGNTSDEDVTEFADRLAAAASTQSKSVILRSQSTNPQVLDPEVAPPSEWQVAWKVDGSEQFTADVADVLTAAAVPGAVGIIFDGEWPNVTVEDLTQFEQVFMQVSATPLFENGGTYTLQSLTEHLRIVHVPHRTSDEAIVEIIKIAREYPSAEVLLEATTSGEQYPVLYVSKLTAAQVREVDAQLRDPRLATADVDGFALEYVLGSISEEGMTYTGGTFGGVAAD